MKAEAGVVLPEPRELQEPPEAGNDKESFSSRNFRRIMTLLAP